MNWCNPHWDQLRQVVKDKGMDGFGSKNGEEAAQTLAEEVEAAQDETDPPFDPLICCWLRINAYMFESPACNGRILQCPLCILVEDGQPHLVENWLNGVTDSALKYALEKGLIQKQ